MNLSNSFGKTLQKMYLGGIIVASTLQDDKVICCWNTL